MSLQASSFVLAGGENHAARPIELKPGELLFSENYEPAVGGGYRLCDGYERYDGRPAPSAAADNAEQETRRAAIQAVPGTGPVRGVWVFQGTVYAFRDFDAETGRMYRATAGGWVQVTTPALLPGGRYRFVNANFLGSASSHKMYGCDGVNPAFQFDGSTFTQISTGMTVDTPIHIAAHKKHLFLAFPNGSLQHSSLGDPLTWTPVTGAGEIGTGDEITALANLVSDVLGVWNRSSTYLLYGSSSVDWQFKVHDAERGALEDTLQLIGGPKYMDDRGLVAFGASDRFGDFEMVPFSAKVDPIMDLFRNNVVASIAVREKSHMRLFRADGYGLCVGLAGRSPEFTRFRLGTTVSCVCNGEASDGAELLFFGSEDGFVYQLDSGTNWDGQPLIAYLRLAFNHFGKPQQKKRVRKVSIEFNAVDVSAIAFAPDFDYSHPDNGTSPFDHFETSPSGGYWGFDQWSEFYWSAPDTGVAEGYVDGSGVNFGLFIRSENLYTRAYNLRSVSLQYDERGMKR